MTDLQVKMAEHLEKERTNRANEAIKERENSAKYGLNYTPYDNTTGWSDIFSTYKKPGEGLDLPSKMVQSLGRAVKGGWGSIGNIVKALV